MKYTISVKETNYGTIVIDAESPEEAIEKAETDYSLGNTIWGSGEYELSDAKRVKERTRDRDSR